MSKEIPDLHKVFDRLFSKSGEKPALAGQALFDPAARKKQRAPEVNLARRLSGVSGTVLGLDLGASAVKLVRAERGNGGPPRVTATFCREISPELSDAERQAFVRQTLKDLQRQGLLRGRVMMGVPEIQVAVEQAMMPKMPAPDLEKAVEWEAKEKMAADASSHCVRHLLVGETTVDGKAQLELLIFAVPKEDVLTPYQLISGAGGKVASAEPGILGSVAALDAAGLLRPEEFVGVMDIGFRNSALAFVVNHKVRFVRSFSVAGDGATRSIADYCKVDYPAAESRKREIGLPGMGETLPPAAAGAETDLRVRAGQALTLYLEKLASEVDHSLRYVTYYTLERSGGRRLDRLYLLGGGAHLKNLAPFLESRLGAEVRVTDPFEKVALTEEAERQIPPGPARTRLASALGLALHG